MTLSTAVSVEWCARYADCRSVSSLLSFRQVTSCLQTSHSRRKLGQDRWIRDWPKWLSVGSMSAFFTIGVMYAAFILDGTTPYSSDQSNSRQRNGASRFALEKDQTNTLPGSARVISYFRLRHRREHTEFTTEWSSSENRLVRIGSSGTNSGDLVEVLVQNRRTRYLDNGYLVFVTLADGGFLLCPLTCGKCGARAELHGADAVVCSSKNLSLVRFCARVSKSFLTAFSMEECKAARNMIDLSIYRRDYQMIWIYLECCSWSFYVGDIRVITELTQ